MVDRNRSTSTTKQQQVAPWPQSIALGVVLAALVVIFYVVTIVKIGHIVG